MPSDLAVKLDFMGVSDMSDYLSRFATYAANTAVNRVNSFMKNPATAKKISFMFSALWEVLPDEIHAKNSSLYIEGLLQDSIKVEKKEFI